MATEAEVAALAEAVSCLLGDMGKDGFGACGYVKALLRVAYEPFNDDPEFSDYLMPLEEAKRIVTECDG